MPGDAAAEAQGQRRAKEQGQGFEFHAASIPETEPPR
jgi:hypothetical protein